MSFTDPPADPVQPEEGQGAAGATTDAPYAEYLDRIPEDTREQVEPIFKEWDANTTRRFQEHAEFRKTWEPYEQAGVARLSTDEVQWLMQFRDALNTPETIKQWYESYAAENGLTPAEAQDLARQQQAAPLDDFGDYDPNAQLAELLKQQLGPVQQELQRITAWRQQQEQQAALAQAQRQVESQMSELKTKHPDEFNQQAIEKLITQYVETDPNHAVQRAFADWQAIRSQVEKTVLQSKVNAPPPAESGGLADGSAPEIKTLAQASEIAREQLRQARGM